MSLENRLKELVAEDGPNIPLRTLAIYCGTTHSTLSRFMRGQLGISEQMRAQIEKGLREYTQLMYDIVREE